MLIIEVTFNSKALSSIASKTNFIDSKGVSLKNNQLIIKIDHQDDKPQVQQRIKELIKIIDEHKDLIKELNASYEIVHKIISQYIEKKYRNQPILNRTFTEKLTTTNFIENFKNSNLENKLITLLSKSMYINHINYLIKHLDKIEFNETFTKTVKIEYAVGKDRKGNSNTIKVYLNIIKHYL